MRKDYQHNLKGGIIMPDITVKYLLSDEEFERLLKITEVYKEKGLDLLPEKQFESIMFCGSKWDIDTKFKFHEWKLGIREDFLGKDWCGYE